MSQRNTGVPSLVSGADGGSHTEMTCTVMQVLERVSSKWSIGILLAAMDGPVRFTELERRVKGISRRMLTLTLRNLERDGLLVRTVYPTVPPKVEYTATDMAKELYDSLQALTAWAERNLESIAAARRRYDAATP
ncbi:winged helix-turn-helix transcriptional regulator [Thermostaphylospora chromogena]|uniref:DNA-binding transcriptional regulator, HxlR family n=1 Tax=Thermostaphylospora chromogena TaxID=35622 RepID=A0A1H0ZQJ2_9ACTN|nr:helix-turn-helix domain-containing protein [Thermostaphylospora chromogena]SDQ29501.1 DNA-binding transcriptional regulator, HxlR family [Thermostaphylospora chromogena]SDR33688.1 DNA-binding transcriptional regulator, HxlR family [Thermostaphylospora chromogena]